MAGKINKNENEFKVLCWNVNGESHYNETQMLLAQHQPHMAFLQEPDVAKKSNPKRKRNTKPHRYTGYRTFSTTKYGQENGKKHYDITTLIKKGVQFSHNTTNKYKHAIDTFQVKPKSSNTCFTVTGLYKPHGVNLDADALEDIVANHQNNIIVGDFNLEFSTDNNETCLDTLASKAGLMTANKRNQPTSITKRGKSQKTIDHILHEELLDQELINFEVVRDYPGASNYHLPIIASYRMEKSTPTKTAIRNIRELDQKAYKKALIKKLASNDHPKVQINCTDQIEAAANRINTIINETLDEVLPKKVPKATKPNNWKPSEYVKFLFKEKAKVNTKIRETKGQPDQKYHKMQQQVISEEIEQHINDEITHKFEEAVKSIGKEPRNSRKYWQKIKGFSGLSKKPESAAILKYNNKEASTAKEKAEIHREYQETVFQENEAATPEIQEKMETLKKANEHFLKDRTPLIEGTDFEPITVDEIKKTLKTTNGTKAPGKDEIASICYKAAPDALLQELADIFNACIKYKYEPQAWKEAIIILIPKDGKDHSHPSGYRPISLLLTILKIYEKTINRRWMNIIEVRTDKDGKPLLPDIQSGFRWNKQTGDHLFRVRNLTTRTTQHNSKGYSTIFISLDLEKAFDKLPHPVIINELIQIAEDSEEENIKYLVFCVANFLAGRKFIIRQENEYSTPGKIQAGVPQGSSLGPTLFNIATADAPQAAQKVEDLNQEVIKNWTEQDKRAFTTRKRQELSSEAAIFADDQAYVQPINLNNGTHNQYQIPLDETCSYMANQEHWANSKKLKFNATKTQMIFTNPIQANVRYKPTIPFYGQKIKCSRELKYLGVIYNDTLSMTPEVTKRSRETKSRLWLLRRLISKSTIKPKEALHVTKTLAISLAQYGAINWLGQKRHEETMNQLDKTALRVACRAESWEATKSLMQYIPEQQVKLSERCAKISDKWYNQNKDTPAIKNSIHNTTKCGRKEIRFHQTGTRPELKIKQAKRYINTPRFFLEERLEARKHLQNAHS